MIEKLTRLIKKIPYLYSEKTSVFLFLIFALLNGIYFVNNFFLYFLNKNDNADEYYQNNLYSIANFSIDKLFYTPSQPYIFISSLCNVFLHNPKMATRSVSLVFSFLLIIFFVKKIIATTADVKEKVFKASFFIFTIYITNQHYIGTSDFLSYLFIIASFFLFIDNDGLKNQDLPIKKSVLIGLLFAFAIATRPTSLILIGSFYMALFLVFGIKSIFNKSNSYICSSLAFFFFVINSVPIIQKGIVVLDVKEIPKETGVTWFERNYLMAKFWDSNQRPTTQWVSTQEVIEFKKKNPNFIFPKNQLEILFREPGLFARQMTRMLIKAMYSSFRFIYFLFPLLLLTLNKKWLKWIKIEEPLLLQSKVIVLLHLISIFIFSFVAVKLFEFRWVIPTLILYVYFSLKLVASLPKNVRYLIYNLCFLSGIVMYIYFFSKTGIVHVNG